jgi:hypothetical protein
MTQYIKEHVKANNVYINDINYILPEIQRVKSTDAVKNIYDFQNTYYIQHNYYLMLGTITIISFLKTGAEYLIDGQHRITAFKILQQDFPERKIILSVDYLYVEGNDDNTIIEELYDLVNKCSPNPISVLGVCKYKIIKGIQKYFSDNFKDYLKTTANPQRPHINLDKLCDYIINNNVIDKLGIHNVEELIIKIKELNKYYSTLSPQQFKKFGVKTPESLISKIDGYSNRLYLGFYNKFEWVDRIADNRQYNELNHISYDYRPKITLELRKKVWNNDLMKGKCFCCQEIIEYTDFECGHVIPVSLGGLTNLENLRPICHKCNKDMGNMNMMEYISL